MMSPILTRSLDTCTLARSTGAAITLRFAKVSWVCATAAALDAAIRAVARRRARAIMTSPLAEHVGGGLQHLVGRADDLGVHLIGALGGDQVGDFGHHLDIGLFEIALLHVAKTVGVGDSVLRRTGGRPVREQIVADGVEAALVDEAVDAVRTNKGWRVLARQLLREMALRV